jgi:hypothetical protein
MLPLRTGLDFVEIGTTLGADLFRDSPWLALEITLGVRAYQYRIREMRRHTMSSSASAARRRIRPVLM